MGDIRVLRYIDELSDREKDTVLSILDKYDINVINILKMRDAYKIETTQGEVCLKRVKHGRSSIKNCFQIVEGLNEHHFNNVFKYIRTRDHSQYVTHKKYIYYVTEWKDGEVCDFSNVEEAKECIALLAKFHKTTRLIDCKKMKLENNVKNWPKVFSNYLYDLEKFKKIIENKIIRNEFDLSYLRLIENFQNRGMVSIHFLNSTEYYKLSRQVNEMKIISYEDFDAHQVVRKDGDYYMVNLDNICIDFQVNDLSNLLQKLLYKKSYQWDFSRVQCLIEAYCEENPLSKIELEVMLALIIFPYKFWKLGKKRYIKQKNWNELKYLKKLNKIIQYDENQQQFLQEFLHYLDEYKG